MATLITAIAIWVALLAGWVLNVVQVLSMESIFDSALGVVKLISIFVGPLGSVLGYIGLF